jgi:hypothetical protein
MAGFSPWVLASKPKMILAQVRERRLGSLVEEHGFKRLQKS